MDPTRISLPYPKKTMKTDKLLLAFYELLTALLNTEQFDTAVAQDLRRRTTRHSARFDPELWKIVNLKLAHQQRFTRRGDKGMVIQLIAEAFKNLAPYFNDRAVREAFRDLRPLGDVAFGEFFVHIPKVRYLGRDKKGPATFTIVTNDPVCFLDLLHDPAQVLTSYTIHVSGVARPEERPVAF